MTDRSRARRRKGSHRQGRDPNIISGEYRARLQENFQEAWAGGVADTIEYWKTYLHKPLFVYFIREARAGGAIKIGKAVSPGHRLKELQCGNSAQLYLEAVILADQDTEGYLHRIWHDFAWVSGEWFDGGYVEAIMVLAMKTAAAQVDAHKAGENMLAITEHLIEDIWPKKPDPRHPTLMPIDDDEWDEFLGEEAA